MALQFPANPVLNEQHLDTSNDTLYVYNGSSWSVLAVSPGTVKTVTGEFPIVSDNDVINPKISLNPSGINLALCSNASSGFVSMADIPNGTLTSITLTNWADKATAPTGVIGSLASIGGALCFHDGSDWKTVTLGSPPA